MQLWITRPIADAGPLIKALEARGHDCHLAPVMQIEHIAGPALDLSETQALVATSANGVRALAKRTKDRSLPIYAVGDATMRQAQDAGFKSVRSAAGDVTSLAALIAAELNPKAGSLLHAAGETLAGDLSGDLKAKGFTCLRETLYRAVAEVKLPHNIRVLLDRRALDGVLVYSPRTASLIVDLLRAEDRLAAGSMLTGFCLSEAVHEAIASIYPKDTVVAAKPNQQSLLAAIDQYAKNYVKTEK